MQSILNDSLNRSKSARNDSRNIEALNDDDITVHNIGNAEVRVSFVRLSRFPLNQVLFAVAEGTLFYHSLLNFLTPS